jgi:hypothetical protein
MSLSSLIHETTSQDGGCMVTCYVNISMHILLSYKKGSKKDILVIGGYGDGRSIAGAKSSPAYL